MIPPSIMVLGALLLGLAAGAMVYRLTLAKPTTSPPGEPVESYLKSGAIDEWNAFRSLNPEWTPNLFGIDLSRQRLDGVDLRLAILRKAVLSGASLIGADLTGSTLEDANLKGAHLQHALLDGVNLTRANLEDANLEGASIRGAKTDEAKGLDVDRVRRSSVREDMHKSDPGSFAENPESLLRLNPRELEELAGQLFTKLGFAVSSTPPTRDGGYDLLISKSVAPGLLATYAVEVKRYASDRPVGIDTVRALLGVVAKLGVSGGILVTTSGFTKDAVRVASKRTDLQLVDYSGLVEMLTSVRQSNLF